MLMHVVGLNSIFDLWFIVLIRSKRHNEYTHDIEYEKIRTILEERFRRDVGDIILEMIK